jgi:hypothetical protein
VSNISQIINLAQQIARQDREIWRREHHVKGAVLPDSAYDKYENLRYIHLLEETIKNERMLRNQDTLKILLGLKQLNDNRLQAQTTGPGNQHL